MSGRIASQAAAGIWVFVVLAAPAVVIWWAGDNGSLGDLSELELLVVGLLVALASSVLAGALMGRALDIADATPQAGRLDPWAALFVATGVLGTVVALVPATTLVLLLPEEDTALGARAHWVALVWVAGAAGSAVVSIWAGRAVLVRRRRISRRTRRASATTGTAGSAGTPPASPPTPPGARAR
jgi:hypothetical protein